MRSQWQGPEEQEGGDAEPPPVAGAGAVVCLMGVSANVREGQQVRQYGLLAIMVVKGEVDRLP